MSTVTAEKRPLSECIGRVVACPDCGKPAEVEAARGAMFNRQPISSKWWVKLKCKGHCGTKLHKAVTPATVLDSRPDGPRLLMLAAAVGRFVACPRCRQKARAVWRDDVGHAVDCTTCGVKSTDAGDVLEVLE
jgi:Zn ribbon nucleic-acid-binding protein